MNNTINELSLSIFPPLKKSYFFKKAKESPPKILSLLIFLLFFWIISIGLLADDFIVESKEGEINVSDFNSPFLIGPSQENSTYQQTKNTIVITTSSEISTKTVTVSTLETSYDEIPTTSFDIFKTSRINTTFEEQIYSTFVTSLTTSTLIIPEISSNLNTQLEDSTIIEIPQITDFTTTTQEVFNYTEEEIDTNYQLENYPVYSTISIGEFTPSNQIVVERQDYIDEYLNWEFEEINNTHWRASFYIDEVFWSDAKNCLKRSNPSCWQNLKIKYFPEKSVSQITGDLLNFNNYPLESLSENIEFSDFNLDISEGKGNFYIVFPRGFKEKEAAKFGFGSTYISTSSTDPFSPEKRNICRTTNKIHVVWKANSTHIAYSNSQDGVNWYINYSFYSNTAGTGERVYEPSMDCNGNNISIVIPDLNLADLIVMISSNEGLTFQKYSPITASVGRYVATSLKGDRVYLAWYNDSADEFIDFMVLNKSTGATLINRKTLYTQTAAVTAFPISMATNGTGTANDRVYIVFRDDNDDDIRFLNSTDGGVTFQAAEAIMVGTYINPSIAFSGSNLFIVADTGTAIFFTNNTNFGVGSWTTPYDVTGLAGNEIEAAVTINELGSPTVLFSSDNQNWFYSLAYRKYSGSWNPVIYKNDKYFDTRLVNTKVRYDNDNRIEMLFRNGTNAPYSIVYSYFKTPNSAPTISNQQSYLNHSQGGFNIYSNAYDPDGLSDIMECRLYHNRSIADFYNIQEQVKYGEYSVNGNCSVNLTTNDQSRFFWGLNLTGTTTKYNTLANDTTNLYVTNGTNTLSSYTKNGSRNWQVNIGTGTLYGVSVNDTHLFVGDSARILYKRVKSTGAAVNSLDYGTGTIYATAVDSTGVYWGDSNYNISKVNLGNLGIIWSVDYGTGSVMDLTVDSGYLYAVDTADNITKIDKTTGATIWSVRPNPAGDRYSIAVDKTTAWVGDNGLVLFEINISNGNVINYTDYGTGTIVDITVDNSFVYFTTSSGDFYKIDKITKKPLYTVRQGSVGLGIVADESYFYGHSRDNGRNYFFKLSKNPTNYTFNELVSTKVRYIDYGGLFSETFLSSNPIPPNTAPRWESNSTSVVSGSLYTPARNYGFQINFTDPQSGFDIGSVKFETNMTTGSSLENITKEDLGKYTIFTNNTNGIWWINFTQEKLAGAGKYVFRWYVKDHLGLENATDQWVYTISKAPRLIDVTFSNGGSGYYPFEESVDCSLSEGASDGSITLFRNSSEQTRGSSIIYPAGSWNMTCFVTEGQNYTQARNEEYLNVSKGSPILSIGPLSEVIFGEFVQTGCQRVSGDPTSLLTLFRNGSEIISGSTEKINETSIVLAAGTYNYSCLISETQNYTVGSLNNQYRIVNKADPTFGLVLEIDSSSESPQTRVYYNRTDIQSTENNFFDYGCEYLLSLNGSEFSNGLIRLGAGAYNITYGTFGCQNYTSGHKEIMLIIEKNQTNPVLIKIVNSTGEYVNQNVTEIYEQEINVTAIPIYENSGSINLYRDEKDITSENFQKIVLGANLIGYAYKANITGNENYTSNATGLTYYVFINKKSIPILLKINGTTQDFGTSINSFINFTVETPGYPMRDVEIWSNYSGGIFRIWDTGFSPLENITMITETGKFQFIGNYSGNQNYSYVEDSSFLTVSNIVINSRIEYFFPSSIKQFENATIIGNCSCIGICTGVYAEIQSDSLPIPDSEGENLQVNSSNPKYIGNLEDNWHLVSWNITGKKPGSYPIKLKCNSTETGNKFSSIQFLEVKDSLLPQWFRNTTSISSGEKYFPSKSYQFNITWNDNVGLDKVLIEHNFTGSSIPHNETVSTNENGEFYFFLVDLAAGEYVWRWYSNDTFGNWNYTDQWFYVVSKETPYLSIGPLAPVSYGTSTQTGCERLIGDSSSTLTLFRNGTSIASGTLSPQNETDIVLGSGTYNYTCLISETQNYTAGSLNNQYRKINRIASSCLLSSSNGWEYTYEAPTTLECICSGDGESHLYINSEQYDKYNSTSTIFPANPTGHNLTCNITEGENYTSSSDSKSLFIYKKDAEVHVFPSTQIQTYPYSILQYCIDNSEFLECRIFRNGEGVPNNTQIVLGASVYYYEANISDTSNYTNWKDTSVLTIEQNQTNPLNIYFSNSTGEYTNQNMTVFYGQETSANATSVYLNSGTLHFYRNEVPVNNPNIEILPAGVHIYKANIMGNENYTSNTTGLSFSINVLKSNSSCSLSSSSGWSYTYSDPTSLECICSGDGESHLYINSVQYDEFNATSVVFAANQLGYNVTCNITEGVNYSSSSDSKLLFISKKPTTSIIYLNSSASQTVEYSSVINMTGVVVGGEYDLTVNLDLNDTAFGTNFINGKNIVMNITSTSSFKDWINGNLTYNLTAHFDGDENHSSSFDTLFFNLRDTTSPYPIPGTNSTNSTISGSSILHSLKWQDAGNLSGYVFQFCNGTWNGTECPAEYKEFQGGLLGSEKTILPSYSGGGQVYGYTKHMLKDKNGVLHILTHDNGQDITYANSTNNGETWLTKELFVGTAQTPNLLMASDGTLYAIWKDGVDIYWANKTVGGEWTPASIISAAGVNQRGFDGTTDDGFNLVSAAIDGNDVIHICVITLEWNNDGNNDWLIYSNFSKSQGWFVAPNPINSTTYNYSGIWLTTDSLNDVDQCDIEVDAENNVYVVGSGGDETDVDIWSSKDGWATRNEINPNGNSVPSIAIDPLRGDIFVAYETGTSTLGFANSTSNSWKTWTSKVIDSSVSNFPDISVTSEGEIYILYEDTTANNRKVLVANSSNKGVTWTTRQVVSDGEGLGNGPLYPSLRGSTFPMSNRIDKSIEFIFWENVSLDSNTYEIRFNNMTVYYTTSREFGWKNDTWTAFPTGGKTDWSNVTKTVNPISGINFAWKVYANDSSGNWNQSQIFQYITTKKPTKIRLFLNDTEGNKNNYRIGSFANFTALLNVSGQEIYLDTNISGWVIQKGINSTLYNMTVINQYGTYNIKAFFNSTPQSQYEPSFVTYYATFSGYPSNYTLFMEDPETTDFNEEPDIENVFQPTLAKLNNGKIKWLGYLNASGSDIDNNIFISINNVTLRTENLNNTFNSSANITMYFLNYSFTPVVYSDGVICNYCQIIEYNGQNLTFNVPHFTSYTTGPNSHLVIWDQNDTKGGSLNVSRGINITFFANYTNSTTGSPISGEGVYCNITFNSSGSWENWRNMTFNQTSLIYEYTRNFTTSGVFFWNVSCYGSPKGYETLNTTDTIEIPPAYLEVELVYPPQNLLVAQNSNIVVNATVFCRGGDCGDVVGTIRYNSSENPDTNISINIGDQPFYIQEQNPLSTKSCPTNPLSKDEYCNLTWNINATEFRGNSRKIGVLFESAELDVANKHTLNSTLPIVECYEDISINWGTIDFGEMDPETTGNPALGNVNKIYNISSNKWSCIVDIWIKGTDFENKTYGNKINVSNMKWNTINNYPTSISLDYAYALVQSGLPQDTNLTTYYWFDLPPVYAAKYNGTLTIKTNQTT